MAEENVGKGCECIHAFEKHYVDEALGMWLEKIGKDIEELEKVLKEEEGSERLRRSAQGAIDIMKGTVLRDLQTVKKRFAEMPSC